MRLLRAARLHIPVILHVKVNGLVHISIALPSVCVLILRHQRLLQHDVAVAADGPVRAQPVGVVPVF